MKKIFKILNLKVQNEAKLEAAKGLIGYVEDELILLSTRITEIELNDLRKTK
ncbi:hypothetical protein WKH56_08655 [Priestia sp. SB1]|uniref:hypothetical protein n=1 Tax=Priestia sp. SB1 TaxID=3132359 RepID=UPI003172753F